MEAAFERLDKRGERPFYKMIKVLLRKIRKAAEIWHSRGVNGLWQRLDEQFAKNNKAKNYQKLIQINRLSDADRAAIRQRIESFAHKPLISVVMPVYNVEERWLRQCIESVIKQLYTNWEFCIADDHSPSPHIRKVLEEYAARDSRFKIIFRDINGHISAASNSALELASGEFVILLDHDDELSEHALYFVAGEINSHPETAMIYSDEDMIDEQGNRYDPKFKPDWSQDFIYSLNLITHLSAYRADILRKIGGFTIGAEGSQDYDLALRVSEQIPARHIRHIPRILYHWRAIQGSVAFNSEEKPYAHERAREAIRRHLKRTGKKAKVSETLHNLHRVTYDLPADLPKVSLITTTKNEKALQDFLTETDYENLELCCETITGKSNAETFNLLAEKANGEILVFLDGDFKPQNSGWLKELAGFARQEEIGAVGARIFYQDETIRHAGVILGVNDLIGFANRGLDKNSAVNFERTQLVSNFSAVSGVLATRREVFESLKGFDAEHFPEGLFDVDFCLRLREKNLRVVLTPYAEFLQNSNSATETILNQKEAIETENFRKRWKNLIENDPFYNPNLSLKNGRFQIEMPPRVKKLRQV